VTTTQSLIRSLQLHPDRVAVRFQGRTRTFQEYGDRVARLAGALRFLGVSTGETVAMLALNSDRYLEYCMAVPWAGAVLNPCNIRWSAQEILYSLEDAESVVLIVDDAFAAMGAEIAARCPRLKAVIHATDGEPRAGMFSYEAMLSDHAPIEDAALGPQDLAGIFYTGGTTGFPKGVMLSHGNLWTSAICYLMEGFSRPGSTYLHAAPMFHLADMGLSFAHFLNSGTHAIVPAFEPKSVIESLVSDEVTDMLLVPTMIQMLVDHPAIRDVRDRLKVERLLYGASPISEAVLLRAMDAMPGVQFGQAYGMTELSPLATFNSFHNHSEEGRKAGKLRAAGRPTFSVALKIVDAEGHEVPRGTVGEVAVRGPNVMMGYWKKPAETAAALRDGWMHTGDGAYMDDDGYIFVVDRMKDMIISGGENVYSAEVENAIAQHPAVASVAVIGIPDDRWGESVHAVIVLKPGTSADAAGIQAHCRERIAGYKCPRSVEFRDALPLSGAGKILKVELRKPFWEGRQRAIA